VTLGSFCEDGRVSWVAPSVDRVEEPVGYDERSMLESMIEWHRATLLRKCAGLSGTQLAAQAVPPSSLSLLGLVRHLADAERAWFRRHFLGQDLPEVFAREDSPDAAFDEASAASAEADYERLLTERALCRAAAAGRSLDEPCAHPGWSQWTLRWVYAHMIEEYARHNGHADLLRESLDGASGE
jgi:uncharacterized damage-inducible protein DinB